jgi:hypothetical protein
VFELETMLKGLPADSDADIPLTADSAREIAAKFSTIRTALRRIVSLEEKNVPKYAQQIAADALRQSH